MGKPHLKIERIGVDGGPMTGHATQISVRSDRQSDWIDISGLTRHISIEIPVDGPVEATVILLPSHVYLDGESVVKFILNHSHKSKLSDNSCNVCGAVATHSAIDILRNNSFTSEREVNLPVGKIKHGCDEHPVESEVIDGSTGGVA